MIEGSKNDTSVNPRGKSTYYRRRLKIHLQKIRSNKRLSHINSRKNRYALHVALRASKDTTINSDGKNVGEYFKPCMDGMENESHSAVADVVLRELILEGLLSGHLVTIYVKEKLQEWLQKAKKPTSR
ncbi:unnamed protein product [Lactuca virosa]|uniref:Uncharacterized protein n=1 Tax=Lactuca virosa TaxID=75947 RepID=A0AAU9MPS0_9ASTR|nr:unnamed protein product [Lactuca virosa]